MSTYVAFLRAINVAGHGTVRMTDVRDAFAAAGATNVATCVQSGNVVFDSASRGAAAVVNRTLGRLRLMLGEEPQIFIRTAFQVAALRERIPFADLIGDRTVKLYVSFLSQRPARMPAFPVGSPKEALELVAAAEREAFVVSRRKPNGFFGFPNEFVESRCGVAATTRNWTTIVRILEMIDRKEQRDSRTGRRHR